MSNGEHKNVIHQTDEITLKELILKIQEFFWEIVKNWFLIFILFIIAACYFFYEVYTTPIKYPAHVKFMLSDDGGDKSGMNMILGGLGLGGFKGKGDLVNLEKIMQLFKTRSVIDKALLTKAVLNGKQDVLGNHIIQQIGYKKLIKDYGPASWSKVMNELNDFQFDSLKTVEDFDEKDQIMLKVLFDNIVGHYDREIDPIIKSSLDEDSEIITLSVYTEKEDLTFIILNSIFEELSNFFINKAIEKQKKTFDVLSFKNDSIYKQLKIAEYSLADFKDRNRKLVTVKGYLKETKLEREVSILNLLYAESVKNLEIADFALRRRKPHVQKIDSSVRPLTAIGKSKKKALIYSSLISVLLGVTFIIGRKIIRDALAN